MLSKKKHKVAASIGALVVLVGIGIFVTAQSNVKTKPTLPIPIPQPTYRIATITTNNPTQELATLVGKARVPLVLEINRIDTADIKKGQVLILPDSSSNLLTLSPFPSTINAASTIPKLMIVSNTIQAFSIYQSGTLVRWGAVSTGKHSTPTPDGLYFANWKGKSVISTEDDSWVMPWYVNLDNSRGISMHQYELPGYPASHSCVRMLESDAIWVYNWIDQWQLSKNGQKIIVHGTPVIISGQYNFTTSAPWKDLIKNPNATTLSPSTIESLVNSYKSVIVGGGTL